MTPAARRHPAPHGDEEELFHRYHEELMKVLRMRWGFTHDTAEDAAHFAWTELLARQPERINIMGWLVVVAMRYAARLRDTERLILPPFEWDADWRVDERDFTDAVASRHVLELVPRLKPQQRQVLGLRMAGYSYDEICELTGHTYTWVNRHITEGREALRLLVEGK